MPPLSPKAGHFGLILPLATSSATLGLALFQYPLFYSFLQRSDLPSTAPASTTSSDASIAGRPLSLFWARFTLPGSSLIAGLATASALSGALAARWLRTHTTLETTAVSTWYVWGSVLAVAHLGFVPFVAGPIARVAKRGDDVSVTETVLDARNRDDMKEWFVVHSVRTALVDVAALVCFAEGVALSFWVTH